MSEIGPSGARAVWAFVVRFLLAATCLCLGSATPTTSIHAYDAQAQYSSASFGVEAVATVEPPIAGAVSCALADLRQPCSGSVAADTGLRGAGDAYASAVIDGGRADGETVFAGHGEYRYGSGDTVVPEGTTLKVYSPHGGTISDSTGLAIEQGRGPAAVTTYGPGSVVPNYTLKPPTGLTVTSGSTTVDTPTQLSGLLEPGMGTVNWAACTEVAC